MTYIAFVVFSPNDMGGENVYLCGAFSDLLAAQNAASDAARKARGEDDREGTFVAHAVRAEIGIPIWEGIP
jgi:hypothetical protein